MEILRKIGFYTFLVLLPLELICVIICMVKGKKTEEILRRVRMLATILALSLLYFGSMVM